MLTIRLRPFVPLMVHVRSRKLDFSLAHFSFHHSSSSKCPEQAHLIKFTGDNFPIMPLMEVLGGSQLESGIPWLSPRRHEAGPNGIQITFSLES